MLFRKKALIALVLLPFNMFDDVFFTQLFLSFLIGGAWVTAVTVAAEKLGTKKGGFLGGLPSTSVIALFFIGLTQTPLIASQSAAVAPIAIGFEAVFLVAYAYLSYRGFLPAISYSILIQLFLSAAAIYFNETNLAFSLIACLVIFSLAFYALEKKLSIKSIASKKIAYTKTILLSRALFAGIIIALAVLLAKIGGPVWGGVFSAFPALFISTLTITNYSSGIKFSRAMTKPLMLSGLPTSIAYVVTVYYAYPALGLYYGTLAAFIVTAVVGAVTYEFIKRKTS